MSPARVRLPRIRPRIAVALGAAGIATAALGTGVLGASAEVRTFEISLRDGSVQTVSVDVEPGTDPWTITWPGISSDDIVAIAETQNPPVVTDPPPLPPAVTSTAAVPPPVTTPTTPEPAPDAGQGEPTAGGDRPGEPQLRGKGAKQRTTGATRLAAGNEAGALEQDDEPDRSTRPGELGLPSASNPTTSIAVPGAAPIGVPNFFIDKFRIPPFLLSLYQAAGTQYGIRWEVLAAINEIETDYGRNLNVSSAGALGWMQFMPATWKQYGVDANGDGRKDPYNPVDAIFAAARYLKAAGADTDLKRAIFAYNNADWYVESVLMRARVVGGLPTDLVGSLTGLTEGRFPVAAKARYADDLSERDAHRRIARGRNAAMPVEPNESRRGINIYAKPGAPVVAVQDGKVVGMGVSARLGRYVKLRDAYGNTYTYAHLGKTAKRHPVLKSSARTAPAAALPERDPAPTRPATAGRQVRTAARTGTPTPLSARKQRLWAHPARPQAKAAGASRQLLRVATAADLKVLDLPAGQVTMKALKVGSRVVGGTRLGMIGRTSPVVAPHMLFEIRPAGRGAPRIDPKPILDGWKLLDSSALYRAEGRNPFFGKDARQPTIGQILLMGKGELERRVLTNPRIDLYPCGRRDIRGARIDRRVLATLEFLAASGLRPSVTSLECGHSTYTTSGNVSEHSTGTAVDIGKINGIPVLGHQGEGSITDITVRRLLTLQGTMQPHQIISLMKYDGADNTLAMADHDDHVHVGFRPLYGENTRMGRQLNAVLKPGQWIKLIDRLGDIANPEVRTTPSAASITVAPARGNVRRGE